MTKKKAAPVNKKPEKKWTKESVIRKFIAIARKLKMIPEQRQLDTNGLTRATVRHQFGTLSELINAVLEKHVDKLLGICDLNILTDQHKTATLASIKRFKRFVITSAVTGKSIHKGFYKTLKQYCKKNNACLLVVPCWDRAQTTEIDKDIWKDALEDDQVEVVMEAVKLNDRIILNLAKVPPRQVDPTTGFEDFIHNFGSQIVASPKLIAKPYPTPKGKMPHYIFTTGAVTVADYPYKSPSEMRRALKAEQAHYLAALVVEVRSDKVYHQRHVEANPDGSFTDAGIMYLPNGKTKVSAPEVMVMGDLHLTDEDKAAVALSLKNAKQLGVKDLIIHDGMNGTSHNRHEKDNHFSKAMRNREDKMDIRKEIEAYCTWLHRRAKTFRAVVDVFSNHSPEWLYAYLDLEDYRKDPLNYEIATELIAMRFNGSEHIIESYFKKMYPKTKNVKFLRLDEVYKYKGTDLGYHGHVGISGARGSFKSIKTVLAKFTIAHFHAYCRNGGGIVAGTQSSLSPKYVKGFGSWSHTDILHYADGSRQPMMMIKGKWRLEGKV
jgi:hypothetical protein